MLRFYRQTCEKTPRYLNENPETRSELSAPLIYKGRVIGVIDLEHTRVNYYTEDHQRTLTTLASQVAISIANARLYQRISEEEQRMERDLNMAREVQLRLLPAAPPTPANAEIAVSFRPARSIGGDVYDFLDYGPAPNPDIEDPDQEGPNDPVAPQFHTASRGSRTVIALGDVSGKAAPAALYAALVSGILRSLAPQHMPPALLLAALNDQLQERRMDAQYVTMLVALWEDSTRTLRLANAGSVQPLLVTHNDAGVREVKTLEVEGFPLGLFPQATYDELKLVLSPGDEVVFFSDGIVDALDVHGKQYGAEELCSLIQGGSWAVDSAQNSVDRILTAVSGHQAGTEHFDDETVLVLRVR